MQYQLSSAKRCGSATGFHKSSQAGLLQLLKQIPLGLSYGLPTKKKNGCVILLHCMPEQKK